MSPIEILTPGLVACQFHATSKKHVLEHLADMAAAHCDAPARAILDAVIKREKLGSTGIGGGVAIPHAIVEGISSDMVITATLDSPVTYDAHDQLPVDVVCMVLGSVGQTASHVSSVAMVSQMLRQHAAQMRGARITEDLITVIGQHSLDTAAA